MTTLIETPLLTSHTGARIPMHIISAALRCLLSDKSFARMGLIGD